MELKHYLVQCILFRPMTVDSLRCIDVWAESIEDAKIRAVTILRARGYSASVENHLRDVIEDYLSGTDEATFYVGGRGEFDSLAAMAVREAKAVHRDKKIQLYLIEPYFHTGLNRDKDYYKTLYDGIIIPQELIGVHPKAAIQKRNRWMCNQAELLIAFVCRDFGGAYKTLKYARRKSDIRIINIAEEPIP